MFWVHMYGRNGNTDQMVDLWDCSFRWMPNLLTEVRGATDQVAASVQSMRNEVVRQQDDLVKLTQAKHLLLRDEGLAR